MREVSFSRRTQWSLAPNPLFARREALERSGVDLLDLTESNPTRCGLSYPLEALQEAFAGAALLPYAPEPFGLLSARAALAADLAEQAPLSPEALILTTSTSESYAWLFKLLCDPGDSVLIPQPSYPLFEYLASLESVTARGYPLELESGFGLSVERLLEAADPTTRAVLVVHPNNPTGTRLRRSEWRALSETCAERGWALIVDEVFLDTCTAGDPDALGSVAAQTSPCLTFVLSGLSKRGALPQVKLGWFSVHGPRALVAEARARLEVIADTYLSVGTPVQAALPGLLPIAKALRGQVNARLAQNRSVLAQAITKDAPFHLLPAEGGASALVRLPGEADEEALCHALLEVGVVVQPGYFFEFPRGRFLVLSLLPEPDRFASGVARAVAGLVGELSAR